jgi:hypothetical protein
VKRFVWANGLARFVSVTRAPRLGSPALPAITSEPSEAMLGAPLTVSPPPRTEGCTCVPVWRFTTRIWRATAPGVLPSAGGWDRTGVLTRSNVRSRPSPVRLGWNSSAVVLTPAGTVIGCRVDRFTIAMS